jgi:hypothetical protein
MPAGMPMSYGQMPAQEQDSSMIGTIAGSVIGGGAGLFSDLEARKERKKQERASRPRHRRMAQIQDALNTFREQKLSSQLTMAQSAFDWANSLRL